LEILDAYVKGMPTGQKVVDLFEGEWSSKMPDSSLKSTPGTADLFDDARITWVADELGAFAGRCVLELGPLEGGHSWMMQQAGAAQVIAIEANTRAFLKCLCVKELFGLDRVEFKLGDFVCFLENNHEKFDVTIASGVLYHMSEPMKVLDLITRSADKLFIWTHYYDGAIIKGDSNLAYKFGEVECAIHEGFQYQQALQSYKQALDWAGFCGGPERTSYWLTRDSIIGFLKSVGFEKITVNFDHRDHPNGPAFALCAKRRPA